MTPTDRFANNAMNGLMNNLVTTEGYANTTPEEIARDAYELADEMMKQKFKRDTNLCSDCKKHPATCKSDPTFGLGLGCDNVIKCRWYRKKDKYKIKTFFRRLYFKVRNSF